MEIEKNFDNDTLTILIKGRIDTYTAPKLESSISEEVDNIKTLILDFKDLEYISSAGLRVLVATQKKSKVNEYEFIIKNINNNIQEILKISKFDRILNIE